MSARKTILAGITILLILAVAGFAQSKTAEQQIRVQIEKMNSGQPRNALFASDAEMWSGATSKPIHVGATPAEIQAVTTSAPGRTSQKGTDTPDKIVVSTAGDMAYELSHFQLIFDDSEGHHDVKGSLLRVWQKSGQDWKVSAEYRRPYGRVTPE